MKTIRLDDLTKSESFYIYSTIGYIKGQLFRKYIGRENNYQTKLMICKDINDLLCELTEQNYLASDNNMLSYAELYTDYFTDKMVTSKNAKRPIFITFYLHIKNKDKYVKVVTECFFKN